MLVPMKSAYSFLDILESRGAAGFVGNGGADTASMMETIAGTSSGALGKLGGFVGPMLPPAASRALSIGQPLLTAGLSGIMSGGFSPASLLSGGTLTGLAGQFLPPQAAQALSMAQSLVSGGPMALLQGLVSRFLPPELQGVFSAVQQSGAMDSALASVIPPTPDSGPTAEDTSSDSTPIGGMAPFAARVGDMHVCPMFDGPKPHVGGPILPPGALTVLIGGPPAARIGDNAICVGPPDTIVQGEPTVLIGGSPAARLGDSTMHGGKIVQGYPTVMIGRASTAAGQKSCTSHASGTGKAAILPETPSHF